MFVEQFLPLFMIQVKIFLIYIFYNFELYFYYVISNFIVLWSDVNIVIHFGFLIFFPFLFKFVFKNMYICVICFKLH